ncbi:cobalamin-binding protein [Ferrimonas lipolytica]|uniref:Cobalamin-binding protein n=1 Tax=Ferrimonas lipolytica TaxID=2724191 RepID=A0A6H1UB56_9GAMM|nr:cobalamin-binding protein [Ferrimonas lipolytica]QIZ76274.1 cobalamin-binding protein [Ferrimonas lipolytica]
MPRLLPLLATLVLSLTASISSAKELPTIAALSPHSVEMLYEIGAGGQIIATVDYADYPAAANQILRVGNYNQLNIEALMLLQPDLIVISKQSTADLLLQQLVQLRIPIVDTSVTSIDQVAQRMAQLGEVTGHPQQADRVAEAFRQKLAQLRQRYSNQQPITVFYQIWPEPLTTVSSGWITSLLSDCSAENVFAGAAAEYPQVSIEQVLVKSPQLILEPEAHGSARQNVIQWQDWPEIPAVKHQLMVKLPRDLVNRTGPRVLAGMAEICQAVQRARHSYAGVVNATGASR